GYQGYLDDVLEAYVAFKNNDHSKAAEIKRAVAERVESKKNVYREFVELEQRDLKSKEHDAFWKKYLAIDADRVDAAAMRMRRDPGSSLPRFSIEIDEQLTKSAEALTRRLHVSLRSVYLSPFVDIMSQEVDNIRPIVAVVM